MKVNSFFCGAGGFDLGFIKAGFEVVGAWDYDKYAVESYRHNVGNHVQQRSILDMTGDEISPVDGWLFGFPCQDLSNAGHMAGLFEGKRSGLFFEVMRLLGEVKTKPQWILAENVRGLKKYLPVLEEEYRKAGYKMYYTLYNSKYENVPQNRERYFVLGVREDIEIGFEFDVQEKVISTKLKDILEDNVDEKYYLNKPMHPFIMEGDISVIGTTAMSVVREDGSVIRDKSTSAWVHDTDKRIGTLSARDYKQPKQILVREATKKGYAEATVGDSVNISHPNSKTRRGRVGKQVAQTLLTGTEQVVVEEWNGCSLRTRNYRGQSQQLEVRKDNIANTITTVTKDSMATNNLRIRKLTPREYARCQGFPDSYEQVVSNTQFYKQMGNAVTVNVSHNIAKQIFAKLTTSF